MKLPKFNPKIKLKFTFGMVIHPILLIVILLEVYFAYSLLYKNLNPQPTEVVVNKIVKVDLPSYEQTTDLIQSRENFVPKLDSLLNQNPFKYK